MEIYLYRSRAKANSIKLLAFFVFGFLLIEPLFSSTTNVDSLRTVFLRSKDTTRLELAIKIAQAFLDQNIDSSAKYSQLALEGSTKLNFQKGKLKSHNLLGNCEQRRGNLDLAMEHYTLVKEISIATKDNKGMAIVLNNIGIIYTNKGEYNEALKSYLEAIDYEKIVGDSVGLAEGYNNVGVVHYYMGDMDNTLNYLKKSIAITEALGDLQVLKKGYINIGALHRYRKEYELALSYYTKGLEISQRLNDESEITICYHNIAEVYAEQGKYKEAEQYYQKALDFHLEFGNRRGMALEYTNLGSLYMSQNKKKEAEQFYLKAIDFAKKGGFRGIIEAAYGGLSKLYAGKGDYKKAFQAMENYLSIKDSLVNVENTQNFAELRTKYETVEKEKLLAEEKIKTETLAREKAQVELTAANRTKLVIALLALVIIIVFASLARIQRNKRLAQAEKDKAIIKERDLGTLAVFNAQEEERKRISKDLHDGIGQQLSGLKMAFQKWGNAITEKLPQEKNQLETLSQILSETADEVRSISHQMMPKALTELGLIEAIEDLLKKSLGQLNLAYQFEHFGINNRLNERIEVSLYRVVQELINNIIKHANASNVSIQLFKNQDKIILIVEDNGVGLTSVETDGHGLLNIKSRVNTLNGEINLEPSPNSGTLATIRIPIT